MKTFLLTLLLVPLQFFGQNSFSISGTVKDDLGNPVPFANVVLDKDNKYAITDTLGNFEIKNVKRDRYEIQITSLGFATYVRTITVNKNVVINATLTENAESLEGVTVKGATNETKKSNQAITVNSLGLAQLKTQALGVENVIKQSTGVVVRQAGGLGSTLNINLNGLTGPAVRQYYDGMPLELYAGALQLNFIPVDVLESVDVYKGIMPVDIGTDALGGGLNLVPLKRTDNYLRTTYSVGSFNTHRFTLAGTRNIGEKMALSGLAFVNYTDNDFVMKNIPTVIDNLRPDGSLASRTVETIDARRFHDLFRSTFFEAAISFKDIGIADYFKFSALYSTRFNQTQQGAFLTEIAVGEATRSGEATVQRITYEKAFFKNKVKLTYNGLLTQSQDRVRDSTTNRYNWRGEILVDARNELGSELTPFPTARVGDNDGSAHRVTLNVDITDNIRFIASNFSLKTTIKGNDPIGGRIDIPGVANNLDPNTIPAVLKSNVFGAEINASFFEEKFTTIAFYKNYRYDAESVDFNRRNITEIPFRNVDANNDGFGFGIKYQVTPELFVRSSYEQTTRIPTQNEVFGDFAGIASNFEIQPEESDNINVGLKYTTTLGNGRVFFVDFGGFLRDQRELIRTRQFGFDRSQFVNQAKVQSRGLELTTKYEPFENLLLNGSFTVQRLEIGESNDVTSSGGSVGADVPNIPKTFFNLGARYKIDRIFDTSNSFDISWTYFFTDRFSITEVPDISTANPDNVVPRQHLNNLDLTYVMPTENLAFSLGIQNILNREIFDNLGIPRPGINFNFKISYSL
ncbi:MAG: TonB-dependent receptor [Bacteroidota bacterium]